MSEARALSVIKPKQMIQVGNTAKSLVGWNRDLAKYHLEEHLLKPPSQQWCTVDCFTQFMCARATEANRQLTRERIGRLFRFLLDKHSTFLVIEYGTTENHGRIQACKIYSGRGNDGTELQSAREQLDRMHRRKQISDITFEKASEILK